MPMKGPMWDWKLGGPRTETSNEKTYNEGVRLQGLGLVARAAKFFDMATIHAPLVLATDYGTYHSSVGAATVLDYCASRNLVPTFWIYTIPNRNQTGGGAATEADFYAFIDDIYDVLVSRPGARAIFELEPDAMPKLYALPGGINGAEALMRKRCLTYVAQKFRSVGSHIRIYLNAGNSNFRPASEMAAQAVLCGIQYCNGVALNTAQSYTIEANFAYFQTLRTLEPLIAGVMISTTKIGPYVRHGGDRVNAAYYNEPVRGTLDGTGGRPNRPTEGIVMGPRPNLAMDVEGWDGLHGLWQSKAAGTSDDAWPKVGDLPDLPSVDAPGPGKNYFPYWESAYDASVGVDWSHWDPYPWGAAARSNNLRRIRR